MLKAYLWLTFSIVAWGSNFVFGKILVQTFSPSIITSLRLLFIVLFLLILAVYKKQLRRLNQKNLLAILSLGAIGVFVNQWSFFKGLETADPTTSALILATTPILATILAAIFLKEKVTIRTFMGAVIAIIGISFVVTKGKFHMIEVDKGLLWIVLTMITFAFMILMTKVLSNRLDPLSITLYSNIVGLIISIPFALFADQPIRISHALPDWAFLIGTAIVVHGIANLIWNHHIRFVDASKASILSNLEPFVAMVMGLILLFKPITLVEIIGSIFIVGGVIFSTYERNQRALEKP